MKYSITSQTFYDHSSCFFQAWAQHCAHLRSHRAKAPLRLAVHKEEGEEQGGRAGRRGLDDKGVVILMLDSKMEPAVARQMVQGSAGEWNDGRFARALEQLTDFFPLAFLCACAGRRSFGICLPLELQHDLESVQNRERGPGSSHEVVLQAAPNRAGLALSETEGPKTQGRARVHPNFRFGPSDARI